VKPQPLELLAAEVERPTHTTFDVFHGTLPRKYWQARVKLS
jgi:hypothetical protein